MWERREAWASRGRDRTSIFLSSKLRQKCVLPVISKHLCSQIRCQIIEEKPIAREGERPSRREGILRRAVDLPVCADVSFGATGGGARPPGDCGEWEVSWDLNHDGVCLCRGRVCVCR